MVPAIPTASAGVNSQPRLKRMGKTMNRTNEGKTSQRTDSENAAIFSVSPVSLYSQIIAMMLVNGIEITKAPSNVVFFASSLAPTTIAPLRTPFPTSCSQTMLPTR